MSQPLLFTPLSIRGVTLRNRVVVSPMLQYAAVDGMPTEWHLMAAGRFAAGGAGLVVMEATAVERRGRSTLYDLGLWDDGAVSSLMRIVDLVHQSGAIAGIQLGHAGRKARIAAPWEGGRALRPQDLPGKWEEWDVVGPSAIAKDAKSPAPRALSTCEVGEVVEAWGQAAERAHVAGFDVLEIHGAHGYLVHQFLSPVSNQRTDQYGGSEENRLRFLLEVVQRIRQSWPQEKPLFLRISAEDDAGWGAAQSVALARRVKALGVDAIDCSSGGLVANPPGFKLGYGYQVPLADVVRREADITTVAVGLIVHAEQAEEILQQGRADLVALGREMLYNPNWALDAAQKLGADPDFALVPNMYRRWLANRPTSFPEFRPSTGHAPMARSAH